jgi:hypothetical protein
VAPTLKLIKTVVNDNGGTATVVDFQAKIDGTDVPWNAANVLNAGSYTASETTLPTYTASVWGGDCNADGTVSLSVGQNKVCTITNDDKPAKLTIVKDADPNDTQDFSFSGTLGVFTLDDDAGVQEGGDSATPNNKVFTGLSTGTTYTVTEGAEPYLWVFKGVTCVNADQTPFVPTVNGQSVSVNLPLGADVTCTFVNHKTSPTRTIGFWQTHTTYTTLIFTTNLLSVMPIGVAPHKGSIVTKEQLFGAFYSDIAKKTTKQQRSALDKARMQLLQQLVAAKLNCAAFGCASDVQTMITNADTAYATGTAAQILASASLLDAYNNSGDTIIIGNAGSATPKTSQDLANKVFWDLP